MKTRLEWRYFDIDGEHRALVGTHKVVVSKTWGSWQTSGSLLGIRPLTAITANEAMLEAEQILRDMTAPLWVDADDGRYAAELDRVCEILTRVHPIGEFKHIGRLEAEAALLELYPADDAELVTEEWLLDCGWQYQDSAWWFPPSILRVCIVRSPGCGVTWIAEVEGKDWLMSIFTRGQVRRFLAALGVELKEGAK